LQIYSIGKLLKIASISSTKQNSRKRKKKFSKKENSPRKPNWPGLLLGRAWKLAHDPLYRPQQQRRPPGHQMRSDGPAWTSPEQKRARPRVGNPSRTLPSSPFFLHFSTDVERRRKTRRPPEQTVEQRVVAPSPAPSPVRVFPLRVSAPPSSGLVAAPLGAVDFPGAPVSRDRRQAVSLFFPFPLSLILFSSRSAPDLFPI
jgi:hypothetical protein